VRAGILLPGGVFVIVHHGVVGCRSELQIFCRVSEAISLDSYKVITLINGTKACKLCYSSTLS